MFGCRGKQHSPHVGKSWIFNSLWCFFFWLKQLRLSTYLYIAIFLFEGTQRFIWLLSSANRRWLNNPAFVNELPLFSAQISHWSSHFWLISLAVASLRRTSLRSGLQCWDLWSLQYLRQLWCPHCWPCRSGEKNGGGRIKTWYQSSVSSKMAPGFEPQSCVSHGDIELKRA